MEQGVVLKIHSNFYYVDTGQDIIECFLRGKFKKNKTQIMVGDNVKFSLTGKGTGVIEELIERTSLLKRPPVANIQQVVIVFSTQNPDPNWLLFDRFLVLAEQSGLEILICFNKIDLVDKETWFKEKQAEIYSQIGYKILCCSAKKEIGIEELKNFLKDKSSVFAGPSGVGKSALLNALQPGLSLRTGELSEKIQRGKHTTRHVELIKLDFGGWVADAPGFSLLNLDQIEKEDLELYFPEIEDASHDCKFNPCLHWKEEQCQVKLQVRSGEIIERRYDHYLKFLTEVIEHRGGKR